MADQANDSVGCSQGASQILGGVEVQEQGGLLNRKLLRQMGEEGCLQLGVSRKALDSYSGQWAPSEKIHSGQPLWPFSPIQDLHGAEQAGFGWLHCQLQVLAPSQLPPAPCLPGPCQTHLDQGPQSHPCPADGSQRQAQSVRLRTGVLMTPGALLPALFFDDCPCRRQGSRRVSGTLLLNRVDP